MNKTVQKSKNYHIPFYITFFFFYTPHIPSHMTDSLVPLHVVTYTPP